MKTTMLMVMLFAIAIIIPCLADDIYPYDLSRQPICSYIEKSSADQNLFELGPNQSWRVNFDKQRKPFAVIGICSYPNGTLEEINEMAKEKIYMPRFTSNSTEPYIKGLEPHSGHISKIGTETFIPFHYVIYPNGNEVEIFANPLIKNGCRWEVNQVMWAMGNWDTNCEAITIGALGDGNLTGPQIRTVKSRILKLRSFNEKAEIESKLEESQTWRVTP